MRLLVLALIYTWVLEWVSKDISPHKFMPRRAVNPNFSKQAHFKIDRKSLFGFRQTFSMFFIIFFTGNYF